mgnify:CR=1 FL=1
MSSEHMPQNKRIPKNTLDPHFKTRLSFAEWRINELQKPQPAGIVNETIASIIELVNGILGQYYNNRDSENKKFDEGDVLKSLGEKMTKLREGVSRYNIVYNVLMWFLFFLMGVFVGIINSIRTVVGMFTSSFIQFDRPQKMFGNYEKVIVPLIIYTTLIVVTVGSEMPWFHRRYNFNIYRLLTLLLVYIISYTELKYFGFMAIFLASIGVEIWLIIQQKGRVES